jgi:hypothetical protein
VWTKIYFDPPYDKARITERVSEDEMDHWCVNGERNGWLVHRGEDLIIGDFRLSQQRVYNRDRIILAVRY